MGKLARDEFEPALVELVGAWLPAGRRTLVVACATRGSKYSVK